MEQTPKPTDGEHLLIVEDGAPIQALSVKFAKQGYAVLSPGDEQRCAAKLNETHFDGVLMDLLMLRKPV